MSEISFARKENQENMRDVNRIPNAMQRLEVLWRKMPDQRLGQFLSNMLSLYYSETKRDPFFPEENDFLSVIEKAVQEMERGQE